MAEPAATRITSLRYKIAIPLALLVIAAVLVPGWLAVNESFRTLTVRAQEAQLLAVRMAAAHLDNTLQEMMQTVEGIAKLDSLRQMNAAWIDKDINEMRLYAKSFTSIFVLDKDGRAVSFVDRPEIVGLDLSHREYFKVAHNERRSSFSDSLLTVSKTITVIASTPILNESNEVVGVLAGSFDVHLQNFNQIILDTRIGISGNAVLVDRKGTVITHPQTERALKQESFARYAVVQEALKGKTGARTYDFEGVEMLGAYAPVPISGWAVVFHQPAADALAPAIALRHWILIALVVSAIIAVLLGFWISYRIARPVQTLTDSATRIGQGDLDGEVPLVGSDEVGFLGRTLNQMRKRLKESYAALQEANKELRELDRQKSIFVSTASHELRTPLTAIKTYAELIRDGDLGAVNERQKDALALANQNIDRLIKLTNTLLDLSRIEAKKLDLTMTALEPANVLEESERLLSGMVRAAGHRLELTIAKQARPVRGDHDRILQVITNLVANAAKYTPTPGVIAIGAAEDGNAVRFWVKDSGIGIPPEETERIFERFYHVVHPLVKERGGAGLGLAIVKGIVEAHGGEIWVESRRNVGSTFSFTLPIVDDPRQEGAQRG